MKLKAIMATAAALLLSTSANALLIDLSGEESDGDAFNVITVSNADSAEVIDVSFEFVFETQNGSWGSELLVQISHLDSGEFGQIGTQSGSCDSFATLCSFDLMWDPSAGTFSAAGSFAFSNTITDGSGDWEILIAESFNDPGIDGTFLDGSFISVNQVAQVPVPATLLLIGLGVAGMGLARRRA